METRRHFKQEIFTILLLLLGIALVAVSTVFFTQLDHIVHVDLYRYGLNFSYEWAEQYWAYSRLLMNSLVISVSVIGTAIALIIVQVLSRRSYFKFVSSPLLILGIFLIGLSLFLVTRLDFIVHHDLYNYGLQFSYEWAEPYWSCAKSIFALFELVIAVNTISVTLMLTGERARALLTINSILFFSGVIVLALSVNFDSSILAFVGLGLVFWGAILFYARPSKYVKENLLLKTTSPSLVSLNQIIMELGYKGKGVYLPPKYLRDLESSKVFINAQRNLKLPSDEQIQNEDKVFLKNPEGMLVTPPGLELARLFEETLGTSFTKEDLKSIEQNMPRLLVEDLEIAQNVQIETVNNIVHFKIENSIYKNMCHGAKNLANICNTLGCPLCSAIACALAKATGKPVIIEKNQISEGGQIIDIEYRLLDETVENKQISEGRQLTDIEGIGLLDESKEKTQ